MTIEQKLTRSAFKDLAEGNSQFALEHMCDLVKTAEDLAPLETAILQLAVTGRLTRSTEKDEPVEELLLRIKPDTLDSWPLVDAKGNPKVEPYALPVQWRWVMLGALLTNIEAGWSPSAQARPKEGDEWGVLKVSACSWGEFRPGENKALKEGQLPRTELEVRTGDFLISRANTAELVARSVVVAQTPPHLMLSDKTLRLNVGDGCSPRYLNLANRAAVARAHYEDEASGTSSSMKNVSQRAIRRTPIPLPPREEQDRIVAIVDELMGLLRKLRVEMAA
ncbi:restriction endonuclease subunit S [Streptomyces enissocaesilis]|uniref:Type I restriction modification DNA specificity domain-containing protein n=1 Tax=Streptomyces enissocaesilis TaxID=332589 RepID=A0ABP6JGN5_9ACTN